MKFDNSGCLWGREFATTIVEGTGRNDCLNFWCVTNANRQVNVVNKKIWQIIMKTIFTVKEEFTVNTQYCSWYNYRIQGNFFRMIFFSVTLQKFKVTNGLSHVFNTTASN